MPDTGPAAVVVLAAGQGTRMRSELAKVLHAMCGRTLLAHVLAATEPLGAETTLVVVGHNRERVTEHLSEIAPDAVPVIQADQRGTGHAVQLALEQAPQLVGGTIVVVPGDAPLLTAETLRSLLARHLETRAAATLLTMVVPDPAGYGRIVRDTDDQVVAIVEERDADEPTKQVSEVNASVYAFEAAALRPAIANLTADNAQHELYLTDVVGVLKQEGAVVASIETPDYREAVGVNDRAQLAEARRIMRDRIVEHWMREGVTVIDPQTTWISVHATLAPDCVIHQNTQLHGTTSVARRAEVGPDTTLRSTTVGEAARVVKSDCTRAAIGPEATIGPYSYLRPGTRIGRAAKVGAFVETKEAVIGDESKVPHLSYVGDAEIGERSNIGAATVFVNYDGQAKHRTTVGDDVRVGSDTMIVAPRSIGDGAYTAAGSVITEDVPPGAMAVARGRQRNVEGWVERRRPGTRAAEAARRAREQATMDEPSPPPGDASPRSEQGAEQ